MFCHIKMQYLHIVFLFHSCSPVKVSTAALWHQLQKVLIVEIKSKGQKDVTTGSCLGRKFGTWSQGAGWGGRKMNSRQSSMHCLIILFSCHFGALSGIHMKHSAWHVISPQKTLPIFSTLLINISFKNAISFI